MLPRTPLTEIAGTALCRVIIPLWLLMGVVFKLYAGSPSSLPQTVRELGVGMGFELGTFLYLLIGLEIFAIGVMVVLARFAKPMAIFMLASFCAILIGEIIKQGESCGCFGGIVPVEPWQMLIADGLLLAAVILFPMRRPTPAQNGDEPTPAPSLVGTAAIAVVLLAIGLGASFGISSVLHPDLVQVVEDDPDDLEMTEDERAERDRTRNPSPRSLPSFWYAEDLSAWVGKPWREIALFQFMLRWPRDLDEGMRYVVFYNKNCEHCLDMFEFDFTQELDAPVVAIEIPADRRTLTSPDALPFPPEEQVPAVVQYMHLPLGPDWIIQSPMALRIEDGIVTCATEGDHRTCLELD